MTEKTFEKEFSNMNECETEENELLKLINPTYEAPKCSECGKEINLTMKQIYNLCLVNHVKFNKGEFQGLCPDCTQNWRNKIKSTTPRGYNAEFMIDEL